MSDFFERRLEEEARRKEGDVGGLGRQIRIILAFYRQYKQEHLVAEGRVRGPGGYSAYLVKKHPEELWVDISALADAYGMRPGDQIIILRGEEASDDSASAT